MWDVVTNPVQCGDGTFRQTVSWAQTLNGRPSDSVYTITISGDAMKFINAHLQEERLKGAATNFTGVIVAFLKKISRFDENPSAVSDQTLTLEFARGILGS